MPKTVGKKTSEIDITPPEGALSNHEKAYMRLHSQLEQDGYEFLECDGTVDMITKKDGHIIAIEIKTLSQKTAHGRIYQAIGQLLRQRYYSFPVCKCMIAIPEDRVQLINDSLMTFLQDIEIQILPIKEGL